MFARQEEEETYIPLLERADTESEDYHRDEDIGMKEPGSSGTIRQRKSTPLPWTQIIVLSFTRLAEPIAYTQIFPVSTLLRAPRKDFD